MGDSLIWKEVMIVGKDTVMVRKRYDRPVLSLYLLRLNACTVLHVRLVPSKGGDAQMVNVMFKSTSLATTPFTASVAGTLHLCMDEFNSIVVQSPVQVQIVGACLVGIGSWDIARAAASLIIRLKP